MKVEARPVQALEIHISTGRHISRLILNLEATRGD